MLGILASATGTAGGVAYIALKGNEEVGWNKICNVYDKFCRYIATSLALSLFATLLLLVLSICSALNSSLILHWVNRFCIGSEFISINARTHVVTLASMEKPGGEARSTSVSRSALSYAKPSSLINLRS